MGLLRCRKCQKKLGKRNKTGYCRIDYLKNAGGVGGRPTKMTPETVNKLEQAFAVGATDLEACFFAEISHEALYNYIKKVPSFHERKESLKRKPVMLAKTNIIKSLQLNDIDTSKWYLERKAKNEFSTKQETEHSGAVSYSFELREVNDANKTIVHEEADGSMEQPKES